MAAIHVAGVATTPLSDLPGNQMSALELSGRVGPCKVETRMDLPSVPRLNLHDVLEEVQRTEAYENNAHLSPVKIEPLSKLRSMAARTVDSKRLHSSTIDHSPASALSNDFFQISNRGEENTSPLENSCTSGDREIDANSDLWHKTCFVKERQLLEDLIEFDEEHSGNSFQNGEELTKLKIDAETANRKASSNEPKVARNLSSKPPVYGLKTNSSSLQNKNKKLNLCGWETGGQKSVSAKRPIRTERRSRTWLPPGAKMQSLHDGSEVNKSGFKFFHYTDIAKYIQQYRKVCTLREEGLDYFQSKSFYPQYLDKTCLMQFDSRDISFPVKYDLSPSRHRIPTNHVVVKKDEPPSALHLKRQSAIDARTFPTCASPAALHDRFVMAKPPVMLTTKMEMTGKPGMYCGCRVEESNTKLIKHCEEKSANSSVSSLSTSNSSSTAFAARQQVDQEDALPFNCTPAKQVAPQLYRSSDDLEVTTPKMRQTRAISSAGGRSSAKSERNSRQEDVPYQVSHKSFSASRLRQIPVEDNSLRERCETRTSNRLAAVLKQENGFGKDNTPTAKSPSLIFKPNTRQSPVLSEKNKRLKSVIAAEIQNLQQRKAMTLEQRKKLDNFRRALSNTTYQSATLNPTFNCPRISGSIRAFYSKTAEASAFSQSACQKERRKVVIKTDPEDNQPIICVTQPRIRQQSEEPRSHFKISRGKTLIGGIDAAIKPHNKDFQNFTKITDLLGSKTRKNRNARSILSANAHGALKKS